MSVGFRPTAADNEIIQAHKRPDESTSDVLRRALRALDRERWQAEARADMERIAAGGEDLSDEPDDWGFDENGQPVDLRDGQPPRNDECDELDRLMHGWHTHGDDSVDVLAEVARELGMDAGLVLLQCKYTPDSEALAKVRRATKAVVAGRGASEAMAAGLRDATAHIYPAEAIKASLRTMAPTMPGISVPLAGALKWNTEALRPFLERDRVTSWKLAHLHAAARRAKNR